MKKFAIGGAVVVILGAALFGVLLLAKPAESPVQMGVASPAQAEEADRPATTAEQSAESLPGGRYADYGESEIAARGYDETILFFYASWCPECRAFDEAIRESNLQPGVQILKVNYDTATDLRQKYGVTLQSSFVSVNDNGEKIVYWQGYGKDKSVDAILENT